MHGPNPGGAYWLQSPLMRGSPAAFRGKMTSRLSVQAAWNDAVGPSLGSVAHRQYGVVSFLLVVVGSLLKKPRPLLPAVVAAAFVVVATNGMLGAIEM